MKIKLLTSIYFFLFITYSFANTTIHIPEKDKDEIVEIVNRFSIATQNINTNYGTNMNVLKNILGRFENKAFNIFKNDGYISFDRFFSELEKNNGIYISSNIKKDNLLFYEFNSKINKKQLISVVPLSIKVENKRITLYVFIRKIGKNYKIVNLKKEIPDWADVYNNKQELITTGDKNLIFERHLSKAKKGSIKDQLAIGEAYFYGRYGVKQDDKKALNWFLKITNKNKFYPSVVDYYLGVITFFADDYMHSEFLEHSMLAFDRFLYVYSDRLLKNNKTEHLRKNNDISLEYYDYGFLTKVIVPRAFYFLSRIDEFYYSRTNEITFVKDYLKSMNYAIKHFEPNATIEFSNKVFNFIDAKTSNSVSTLKGFDKIIYDMIKEKKMKDIFNFPLDYPDIKIISYECISKLLMPLALNNKEACILMGKLYLRNDYKYKSLKNAEYFFKKAKNGYSLSVFYLKLGKEYFVKENYNKAYEYFKKSANYNDDDAMYYLGQIYDNGLGVKQNLNKAIYWYQKSANSGNEEAKEALEILK